MVDDIKPSVKTEEEYKAQTIMSSSSSIKFAPPPRFGGEALSSDEAKNAISWIDLMTDHLRRLALVTKPWSDELAVEVAISFMDNEPRKVAKRALKELAETATWLLIAKDLRDHFAPRESPFEIVERLSSVAQGKHTLQMYISDFTSKLDDAIDVGFSDPVSACQLFLRGLNEDLRLAVMDTLSSKADDPWLEVVKQKPAAAVRGFAQIALRRADYVRLQRESDRQRARVAVVDAAPRPRQAAVASRVDADDREARREQFIKSLVKRLGLPETLIRSRIEASACAKCGSSAHHIKLCTAPAPVGAVPAGAPKAHAH